MHYATTVSSVYISSIVSWHVGCFSSVMQLSLAFVESNYLCSIYILQQRETF